MSLRLLVPCIRSSSSDLAQSSRSSDCGAPLGFGEAGLWFPGGVVCGTQDGVCCVVFFFDFFPGGDYTCSGQWLIQAIHHVLPGVPVG